MRAAKQPLWGAMRALLHVVYIKIVLLDKAGSHRKSWSWGGKREQPVPSWASSTEDCQAWPSSSDSTWVEAHKSLKTTARFCQHIWLIWSTFPALLHHSTALHVGINHIREQLYNLLGTATKRDRRRWGNSEDVLTPSSQFFQLPYLLHSKVQLLLTLWQLYYYPCFPSEHGEQSFLTSMINPFSPLCCLPVSAIPPHLNAVGEKVKFQHSSSTSNCKTFRAMLFPSTSCFYSKSSPVILVLNLLGKVWNT